MRKCRAFSGTFKGPHGWPHRRVPSCPSTSLSPSSSQSACPCSASSLTTLQTRPKLNRSLSSAHPVPPTHRTLPICQGDCLPSLRSCLFHPTLAVCNSDPAPCPLSMWSCQCTFSLPHPSERTPEFPFLMTSCLPPQTEYMPGKCAWSSHSCLS